MKVHAEVRIYSREQELALFYTYCPKELQFVTSPLSFQQIVVLLIYLSQCDSNKIKVTTESTLDFIHGFSLYGSQLFILLSLVLLSAKLVRFQPPFSPSVLMQWIQELVSSESASHFSAS